MMTKEEIKIALHKRPSEVTKNDLKQVFGIFSLLIKEYSISEQKLLFEVHFKRIFIIGVDYPIGIGFMSFYNDFVNFGDENHGVAMPRSKKLGELLILIINMFNDDLLRQAKYCAYYDDENSIYSSQEQMQEYLEFAQDELQNL